MLTYSYRRTMRQLATQEIEQFVKRNLHSARRPLQEPSHMSKDRGADFYVLTACGDLRPRYETIAEDSSVLIFSSRRGDWRLMRASGTKELWPVPKSDPNLALRDVHVWRIALMQPEITSQRCRRLLSHEEVGRADKFHFAHDRGRFLIAHAALRQILALYLHARPELIQFAQQKHGKPELAPHSNPIGLTFNLSHSGGLGLLAVALHTQLGIDVECVRSDFGGQEIAEQFFSESEVDKLRLLPAGQRNQAFFQCWTRKEAYIKARGEGLSIPLASFEVAFGPGEPPRLLTLRENPTEASRWSFYDLRPGDGYVAALVIEGKNYQLERWTWQGSFLNTSDFST